MGLAFLIIIHLLKYNDSLGMGTTCLHGDKVTREPCQPGSLISRQECPSWLFMHLQSQQLHTFHLNAVSKKTWLRKLNRWLDYFLFWSLITTSFRHQLNFFCVRCLKHQIITKISTFFLITSTDNFLAVMITVILTMNLIIGSHNRNTTVLNCVNVHFKDNF